MTIEGLRLTVRADTKQAKNEFRSLNQSVNRIGVTAQKSTGHFDSLAESAKKFAAVAVGLYAAQRSLRGITNITDSYRRLEARIALTVDTLQEQKSVFKEINQIAIETRLQQEGLADLFSRIGRATHVLGVQNKDVLQVTRSIAQSIVISGSSATSAAAAIVQLGQGLAAGALRGQELNSVLEQTPGVAKAIARGLKLTVGELRAFANAGKLTAEAVLQALIDQKSKIDEEFARIPLTFAQSLVVFGTGFGRVVNEIDDAFGFTRGLSESFRSIGIFLNDAGESIGNFFRGIVGGFKILKVILVAPFDFIGDVLSQFFRLNELVYFVEDLGEKLKTAFTKIKTFIVGIFTSLYDTLVGNSIWIDTIDRIAEYGAGLVERLKAPFEALSDFVEGIFVDLFCATRRVVGGSVVESAEKSLKSIYTTAKKLTSSFTPLDTLSKYVKSTGKSFRDVFATLPGFAKDSATATANAFKTFSDPIVGGISKGLNSILGDSNLFESLKLKLSLVYGSLDPFEKRSTLQEIKSNVARGLRELNIIDDPTLSDNLTRQVNNLFSSAFVNVPLQLSRTAIDATRTFGNALIKGLRDIGASIKSLLASIFFFDTNPILPNTRTNSVHVGNQQRNEPSFIPSSSVSTADVVNTTSINAVGPLIEEIQRPLIEAVDQSYTLGFVNKILGRTGGFLTNLRKGFFTLFNKINPFHTPPTLSEAVVNSIKNVRKGVDKVFDEALGELPNQLKTYVLTGLSSFAFLLYQGLRGIGKVAGAIINDIFTPFYDTATSLSQKLLQDTQVDPNESAFDIDFYQNIVDLAEEFFTLQKKNAAIDEPVFQASKLFNFKGVLSLPLDLLKGVKNVLFGGVLNVVKRFKSRYNETLTESLVDTTAENLHRLREEVGRQNLFDEVEDRLVNVLGVNAVFDSTRFEALRDAAIESLRLGNELEDFTLPEVVVDPSQYINKLREELGKQTFFGEIGDRITRVFNSINPFFDPTTFEAVRDAAIQVLRLGGQLENFTLRFLFKRDVEDFVNSIYDYFNDIPDFLENNAVQSVRKYGRALIDGFIEIGKLLREVLRKIFEPYVDIFKKARLSAIEDTAEYAAIVAAAFAAARESATINLEPVIDLLVPTSLFGRIRVFLDRVQNAITSGFKKAFTTKFYKDLFNNNITTPFGEALDEVGRIADASLYAISGTDTTREALGRIGTAAATVGGEVALSAIHIGRQVRDSEVGQAVEGAIDEVVETVDEARTAIGKAFNELLDFFRETFTGFIEGVGKIFTDTKTFIREKILTPLRDTFIEIRNELYEVIQEIIPAPVLEAVRAVGAFLSDVTGKVVEKSRSTQKNIFVSAFLVSLESIRQTEVAQQVIAYFNGVLDIVKERFTGFKNFFRDILRGSVEGRDSNAIALYLNSILVRITGAGDSFTGFLGDKFTLFKDSEIVTSVTNFLKKIDETLRISPVLKSIGKFFKVFFDNLGIILQEVPLVGPIVKEFRTLGGEIQTGLAAGLNALRPENIIQTLQDRIFKPIGRFVKSAVTALGVTLGTVAAPVIAVASAINKQFIITPVGEEPNFLTSFVDAEGFTAKTKVLATGILNGIKNAFAFIISGGGIIDLVRNIFNGPVVPRTFAESLADAFRRAGFLTDRGLFAQLGRGYQSFLINFFGAENIPSISYSLRENVLTIIKFAFDPVILSRIIAVAISTAFFGIPGLIYGSLIAIVSKSVYDSILIPIYESLSSSGNLLRQGISEAFKYAFDSNVLLSVPLFIIGGLQAGLQGFIGSFSAIIGLSLVKQFGTLGDVVVSSTLALVGTYFLGLPGLIGSLIISGFSIYKGTISEGIEALKKETGTLVDDILKPFPEEIENLTRRAYSILGKILIPGELFGSQVSPRVGVTLIPGDIVFDSLRSNYFDSATKEIFSYYPTEIEVGVPVLLRPEEAAVAENSIRSFLSSENFVDNFSRVDFEQDTPLDFLSRALRDGIINAEELNALLRESPNIVQAIAIGLGVTVEQLQEFSIATDYVQTLNSSLGGTSEAAQLAADNLGITVEQLQEFARNFDIVELTPEVVLNLPGIQGLIFEELRPDAFDPLHIDSFFDTDFSDNLSLKLLQDGLRDGALSAEDLNNIFEKTPSIVNEMASSIGLTVDQLKEFADYDSLPAAYDRFLTDTPGLLENLTEQFGLSADEIRAISLEFNNSFDLNTVLDEVDETTEEFVRRYGSTVEQFRETFRSTTLDTRSVLNIPEIQDRLHKEFLSQAAKPGSGFELEVFEPEVVFNTRSGYDSFLEGAPLEEFYGIANFGDRLSRLVTDSIDYAFSPSIFKRIIAVAFTTAFFGVPGLIASLLAASLSIGFSHPIFNPENILLLDTTTLGQKLKDNALRLFEAAFNPIVLTRIVGIGIATAFFGIPGFIAAVLTSVLSKFVLSKFFPPNFFSFLDTDIGIRIRDSVVGFFEFAFNPSVITRVIVIALSTALFGIPGLIGSTLGAILNELINRTIFPKEDLEGKIEESFGDKIRAGIRKALEFALSRGFVSSVLTTLLFSALGGVPGLILGLIASTFRIFFGNSFTQIVDNVKRLGESIKKVITGDTTPLRDLNVFEDNFTALPDDFSLTGSIKESIDRLFKTAFKDIPKFLYDTGVKAGKSLLRGLTSTYTRIKVSTVALFTDIFPEEYLVTIGFGVEDRQRKFKFISDIRESIQPQIDYVKKKFGEIKKSSGELLTSISKSFNDFKFSDFVRKYGNILGSATQSVLKFFAEGDFKRILLNVFAIVLATFAFGYKGFLISFIGLFNKEIIASFKFLTVKFRTEIDTFVDFLVSKAIDIGTGIVNLIIKVFPIVFNGIFKALKAILSNILGRTEIGRGIKSFFSGLDELTGGFFAKVVKYGLGISLISFLLPGGLGLFKRTLGLAFAALKGSLSLANGLAFGFGTAAPRKPSKVAKYKDLIKANNASLVGSRAAELAAVSRLEKAKATVRRRAEKGFDTARAASVVGGRRKQLIDTQNEIKSTQKKISDLRKKLDPKARGVLGRAGVGTKFAIGAVLGSTLNSIGAVFASASKNAARRTAANEGNKIADKAIKLRLQDAKRLKDLEAIRDREVAASPISKQAVKGNPLFPRKGIRLRILTPQAKLAQKKFKDFQALGVKKNFNKQIKDLQAIRDKAVADAYKSSSLNPAAPFPFARGVRKLTPQAQLAQKKFKDFEKVSKEAVRKNAERLKQLREARDKAALAAKNATSAFPIGGRIIQLTPEAKLAQKNLLDFRATKATYSKRLQELQELRNKAIAASPIETIKARRIASDEAKKALKDIKSFESDYQKRLRKLSDIERKAVAESKKFRLPFLNISSPAIKASRAKLTQAAGTAQRNLIDAQRAGPTLEEREQIKRELARLKKARKDALDASPIKPGTNRIILTPEAIQAQKNLDDFEKAQKKIDKSSKRLRELTEARNKAVLASPLLPNIDKSKLVGADLAQKQLDDFEKSSKKELEDNKKQLKKLREARNKAVLASPVIPGTNKKNLTGAAKKAIKDLADAKKAAKDYADELKRLRDIRNKAVLASPLVTGTRDLSDAAKKAQKDLDNFRKSSVKSERASFGFSNALADVNSGLRRSIRVLSKVTFFFLKFGGIFSLVTFFLGRGDTFSEKLDNVFNKIKSIGSYLLNVFKGKTNFSFKIIGNLIGGRDNTDEQKGIVRKFNSLDTSNFTKSQKQQLKVVGDAIFLNQRTLSQLQADINKQELFLRAARDLKAFNPNAFPVISSNIDYSSIFFKQLKKAEEIKDLLEKAIPTPREDGFVFSPRVDLTLQGKDLIIGELDFENVFGRYVQDTLGVGILEKPTYSYVPGESTAPRSVRYNRRTEEPVSFINELLSSFNIFSDLNPANSIFNPVTSKYSNFPIASTQTAGISPDQLKSFEGAIDDINKSTIEYGFVVTEGIFNRLAFLKGRLDEVIKLALKNKVESSTGGLDGFEARVRDSNKYINDFIPRFQQVYLDHIEIGRNTKAEDIIKKLDLDTSNELLTEILLKKLGYVDQILEIEKVFRSIGKGDGAEEVKGILSYKLALKELEVQLDLGKKFPIFKDLARGAGIDLTLEKFKTLGEKNVEEIVNLYLEESQAQLNLIIEKFKATGTVDLKDKANLLKVQEKVRGFFLDRTLSKFGDTVVDSFNNTVKVVATKINESFVTHSNRINSFFGTNYSANQINQIPVIDLAAILNNLTVGTEFRERLRVDPLQRTSLSQRENTELRDERGLQSAIARGRALLSLIEVIKSSLIDATKFLKDTYNLSYRQIRQFSTEAIGSIRSDLDLRNRATKLISTITEIDIPGIEKQDLLLQQVRYIATITNAIELRVLSTLQNIRSLGQNVANIVKSGIDISVSSFRQLSDVSQSTLIIAANQFEILQKSIASGFLGGADLEKAQSKLGVLRQYLNDIAGALTVENLNIPSVIASLERFKLPTGSGITGFFTKQTDIVKQGLTTLVALSNDLFNKTLVADFKLLEAEGVKSTADETPGTTEGERNEAARGVTLAVANKGKAELTFTDFNKGIEDSVSGFIQKSLPDKVIAAQELKFKIPKDLNKTLDKSENSVEKLTKQIKSLDDASREALNDSLDTQAILASVRQAYNDGIITSEQLNIKELEELEKRAAALATSVNEKVNKSINLIKGLGQALVKYLDGQVAGILSSYLKTGDEAAFRNAIADALLQGSIADLEDSFKSSFGRGEFFGKFGFLRSLFTGVRIDEETGKPTYTRGDREGEIFIENDSAEGIVQGLQDILNFEKSGTNLLALLDVTKENSGFLQTLAERAETTLGSIESSPIWVRLVSLDLANIGRKALGLPQLDENNSELQSATSTRTPAQINAEREDFFNKNQEKVIKGLETFLDKLNKAIDEKSGIEVIEGPDGGPRSLRDTVLGRNFSSDKSFEDVYRNRELQRRKLEKRIEVEKNKEFDPNAIAALGSNLTDIVSDVAAANIASIANSTTAINSVSTLATTSITTTSDVAIAAINSSIAALNAVLSSSGFDPVALVPTPTVDSPVTSPDSTKLKAATGGFIQGEGTGTSDSILANLSNGEFVVNAKSTKRNRRLLAAINSGFTPTIPGFQNGTEIELEPPSSFFGKLKSVVNETLDYILYSVSKYTSPREERQLKGIELDEAFEVLTERGLTKYQQSVAKYFEDYLKHLKSLKILNDKEFNLVESRLNDATINLDAIARDPDLYETFDTYIEPETILSGLIQDDSNFYKIKRFERLEKANEAPSDFIEKPSSDISSITFDRFKLNRLFSKDLKRILDEENNRIDKMLKDTLSDYNENPSSFDSYIDANKYESLRSFVNDSLEETGRLESSSTDLPASHISSTSIERYINNKLREIDLPSIVNTSDLALQIGGIIADAIEVVESRLLLGERALNSPTAIDGFGNSNKVKDTIDPDVEILRTNLDSLKTFLDIYTNDFTTQGGDKYGDRLEGILNNSEKVFLEILNNQAELARQAAKDEFDLSKHEIFDAVSIVSFNKDNKDIGSLAEISLDNTASAATTAIDISTNNTIIAINSALAALNAALPPGGTVAKLTTDAKVDMATGGFIQGEGTGTSDSILANLSNGEFVVNAKSTKRNKRLLAAINSGFTPTIPGFVDGSLTTGSPTSTLNIDTSEQIASTDRTTEAVSQSGKEVANAFGNSFNSFLNYSIQKDRQEFSFKNVLLRDITSVLIKGIGPFIATTIGKGSNLLGITGGEDGGFLGKGVDFLKGVFLEGTFSDFQDKRKDKFNADKRTAQFLDVNGQKVFVTNFADFCSCMRGGAPVGKSKEGKPGSLGFAGTEGFNPTGRQYDPSQRIGDGIRFKPTDFGILEDGFNINSPINNEPINFDLTPQIETGFSESSFGSTLLNDSSYRGGLFSGGLGDTSITGSSALGGTVTTGFSGLGDRVVGGLDTLGNFINTGFGKVTVGLLALAAGKLGGKPSAGLAVIGLALSVAGTVASANAAASAASTAKAATGGLIRGPGTGTSDSIPALLSNGEYVINAAATKRNMAILESINAGALPKFADGGLVGKQAIAGYEKLQASKSEETPSPMTQVIEQTIQVTGNVDDSTRRAVRDMGSELVDIVQNGFSERGVINSGLR